MNNTFPAHGKSEIRRINKLIYFHMSGLWNIEAFQEALARMEEVRDSFGDDSFVKITDLREWEGGTREGLDFDAEMTPEERSPEAAVVVVSNSFQRDFMRKHLNDAVSGKHPYIMEESLHAAISRLVSDSYITTAQAAEIRAELLPDD